MSKNHSSILTHLLIAYIALFYTTASSISMQTAKNFMTSSSILPISLSLSTILLIFLISLKTTNNDYYIY